MFDDKNARRRLVTFQLETHFLRILVANTGHCRNKVVYVCNRVNWMNIQDELSWISKAWKHTFLTSLHSVPVGISIWFQNSYNQIRMTIQKCKRTSSRLVCTQSNGIGETLMTVDRVISDLIGTCSFKLARYSGAFFVVYDFYSKCCLNFLNSYVRSRLSYWLCHIVKSHSLCHIVYVRRELCFFFNFEKILNLLSSFDQSWLNIRSIQSRQSFEYITLYYFIWTTCCCPAFEFWLFFTVKWVVFEEIMRRLKSKKILKILKTGVIGMMFFVL